MASMKTMMMCVVDVGASMNGSIDSNLLKLELGLQYLSQFILQKIMTSKTAEFSVITYGDEVTKNPLNQSSGGYEGVQIILDMCKPSPASLKSLSKIKPSSIRGDLIDGIVVGQDILIRANAGKAYNRIMVLITDGETAVEGLEDLEVVLNSMKDVPNFGLYICLMGKINQSSSLIKVENAKLFKSMLNIVPGRYIEANNITDCFHLLASAPGLSTKPQILKLSFEITPDLKIPCMVWNKVMKSTLPSLKKESLTHGSAVSGLVKRDTSYRNPDDPDQELTLEERVKGFRYGSQYIPVTDTIEDAFKLIGPAGIKLLGFISNQKVPRFHYLDAPMSLVGSKDSEAASQLIASLCRSMNTLHQIALVRVVKRDNGDPYLAAAIPSVSSSPSSSHGKLLLHRIPCCEDVRTYAFPSLNKFTSQLKTNPKLAKSQQNIVSKWMDSLTLRSDSSSNALASDAEAIQIPVNPSLHSLISKILTDQQILSGHINKIDSIRRPQSLPKLSESMVNEWNQLFPLVKNDLNASKRKRKIFWSEVNAGKDVMTSDAKMVSEPNQVPKLKKVKDYVELELDEDFVLDGAVNLDVKQETDATQYEVLVKHIKEEKLPVQIKKKPMEMKNEPIISKQSYETHPAIKDVIIKAEVPSENDEVDEDDLEQILDQLPNFIAGSIMPEEDFKDIVLAAKTLPGIQSNQLKAVMVHVVHIMGKIIERNIILGESVSHYRRAISCVETLRTVAIQEKLTVYFNQFLKDVLKPRHWQSKKEDGFWYLFQKEGGNKVTLISKDEDPNSLYDVKECEDFIAIKNIKPIKIEG